ncbi:MAG TPA: ATP-binding protein [Bacteroidota bacterium]|nr:ATP-binding protein [Bacteroidota bacterium]
MNHLRTRLLLTYIGVTILVLAGLGTLATLELDSYFRQWLTHDLGTRADLILASLKHSQADHSELISLAGSAGVRVTFVDSSGVVVNDSEIPDDKLSSIENHRMRPEIQQAFRQGSGIDTRRSATIGVDYLYLAKRITDSVAVAGRRVEIIRVSIPLTELKSMTDEIRSKIFYAGSLVLLLVVGVSMIVSYRISRPMVKIAESAEKIRAGDLDTRIEIRSKDEIGQVAHAVNEMVDQLKQDIAKLKKLELVRSQFLGNVSHELRTPIFALQGFLETLLDGAIDDPNVNRDFLEKAHAHAMRLNTLLNDLIEISSIESGEMKMSFRYFNVKEFLASAVEDFQQVAASQSVALTLAENIDPALQVLGDRNRLMQVMSNLINNAIKYNTEGGSVIVSVRDEKNIVWIDVADTGYGIEEEHLTRIFERFYRVDKERSREAGGTGLGLAIVKHIVEAHGGQVKVTSTPGNGSTFSFPVKK